MKCLDGVIEWMYMSLSKLREMGILACCSPWGCKELDMTETELTDITHFILISFFLS